MKEFNFAIKQTFPIFFTYLFIGIAFGILMGDAGYPPFLSLVAGFFIYAGSLQIVMVSLLQAHAPLITVAIMSFFINARHIFYGVAFIEKFRKMGWKYPYMVLTLTDETYSILCSVKYEENLDREKEFYIKGDKFTLEEFFADRDLAEKYRDGVFMIIRLAPIDYHRFHFPADGEISESKLVDGVYYSVSTHAIKKNFRILCENKREYSILKTIF